MNAFSLRPGSPRATSHMSGDLHGWRLWFSRHNWLTWLGLCFLVPLVFYYWHHYTSNLREQQQAVFQQYANTIEHELSEHLNQIKLLLGANVAFVSASEYISQAEWQHYVDNLDLPTLYPGVQALGIVSYRHHEQLPDLLGPLNHELNPDPTTAKPIEVYPAGDRPFYAIISHIQPMTGQNRVVLGYDILTDPMRTQTAMRAASLNNAAITGKISLQQDGQTPQPGLVLMLPFYQADMPLVTAEQKQAALQGFVYAAFRVKDILPSHWHDPATVLPDILWFSGISASDREPEPEQLLFSRDSAKKPALELLEHRHLDWYGHPFVLEIKSNALFEHAVLPQADYDLVMLGSVALLLLFLLLSYLNLRRYQAQCSTSILQQQIQQQRQDFMLDEQHQSLALKASQLVWFEFDFRTGGAFYADNWWQMFDFVAPQPNPEPQQLFDLLHPSALASFRQDLQRMLANGPDQAQQKYRFISRQGRQLCCLVNFYIVRAPEGDAVRLCCTMQDITLQQQQYQEQQQVTSLCLEEVTAAFKFARSTSDESDLAVFLQQHTEWLLQFYAQQCRHHHAPPSQVNLHQVMVPLQQIIGDTVQLLQSAAHAKGQQLMWQPQSRNELQLLARHPGWQLMSSLLQLAIELANPHSKLQLELVAFQSRLAFRINLQLPEHRAKQVATEFASIRQSLEPANNLFAQKLMAVTFWAKQQGVELSEQQVQQQLNLQLLFP